MFSIAAVFNVYLLLFCVCFSFFWYYSTMTFHHWKKQRIPFKKPVPIFGNIHQFALFRCHYIVVIQALYTYFQDHPYGGFFEMLRPVLLIKNPDLVHDILVKDFNTFPDRGFDFLFPHKKLNPLSTNIFFEDGNRWRGLRKKMTPVFTSSKLRVMHEPILRCIANLNKLIEKSMLNGSTNQDLKALYSKLTVDVIGCCCFGIDCDSLKENEEFRIMATKTIEPSATKVLAFMMNRKLKLFLKITDFSKEVTDFFMRTVLGEIRHRRKNDLRRNDLLQLLMELQNSYSDLEYKVAESQNNISERFDEIDIVANSTLFFVAGFESTSSTIAHCLYELAQNQNAQNYLRTEVTEAYNKNDHTLTHEMLKEMKYLNAAISETLRKYPSAAFINRVSTEDYQIPNSKKVIKKGTKIMIPTWSLHHDETYYKNPEDFDPQRFYGENKRNIQRGTYIPFSDGPRNCIGARFAEMAIRAAVADAILRYKFAVCSQTEIPLTFQKGGTLLTANGVWINITKHQT